jgi:hypothetical protein
MCGIALTSSGRSVQLPVSPRALMWLPFRFCERQSGLLYKANNYCVICGIVLVDVKTNAQPG